MFASRSALSLFLSGSLLATLFVGRVEAEPLSIKPHDTVVVLGNTLAERMHLFGYFETALHSRFPDHEIKFRNMGWSADEVGLMVRPRGFPPLLEDLDRLQADLVFLCFGMNESFRGEEHLEDFRNNLGQLVGSLQQRQFNGESPPRIVLVSPVAHETLPRDLPNGIQHDEHLTRYSEVIAETADKHQARYIDLFTPTTQWVADHPDKKLTLNGIHLTEYGDWVVSRMIVRSLGWSSDPADQSESDSRSSKALRRAIYEKNYEFFNWWHPPNASYIHGRRNDTEGAKHLAQERLLRLRLVAKLDQQIWKMPKPKLADVWIDEPLPGKPVWYPTPSDRRVSNSHEPPQQAVASDGKSNLHTRSPRDQLKTFRLPDGYKVNLYASELNFPIANPMAIQFDARGRLWVANTPTWPHSLPGKQPQDSIVILEDTDRDGVADQHRVFLDKLNLLHGFAIHGDGALVAQTPSMIWARDVDGDDQADWLEVVLHGFGAEDAEHAMNNFRWGPDGALYFAQGIFYHTQVETPYGPTRVKDSAVFRYEPRKQKLEAYVSHAFWNPYGLLFDRWGRGIILDASAGQYYPMDVLSANFVYPKRKERTDHLSMVQGGSIAAGCEWLYSRQFPDEVQGRFLVNHCEGDVGVHWFTLSPEGTLYQAERHESPLLSSTDKTFRPVAMTFGPDGALYVADFYSHIFENVNFSKRHPGRDHTHGRIWRISCPNRPALEPPAIVDQPLPELLELLMAYEPKTREFARRELQQRSREQVLSALKAWIARLDSNDPEYEHWLVEALWVTQGLGNIDVDLLKQLLSAQDANARVAATQALRFCQHEIDEAIDLIADQVDDPDPRVRLHAVLACGFSESERRFEVALDAAEHPLDPGLDHALDETLKFLEHSETKEAK